MLQTHSANTCWTLCFRLLLLLFLKSPLWSLADAAVVLQSLEHKVAGDWLLLQEHAAIQAHYCCSTDPRWFQSSLIITNHIASNVELSQLFYSSPQLCLFLSDINDAVQYNRKSALSSLSLSFCYIVLNLFSLLDSPEWPFTTHHSPNVSHQYLHMFRITNSCLCLRYMCV